MERRCSGVIGICLAVVLGGCGDGRDSDGGEDAAELDQGELQALLRDEPVMQPGGAAATSSALARSLKPRPTFFPQGRWGFDDCDPGRAELFNDSSFNANPAYRSLGVTCTEGVIGQAVALGEREDLVYVPDQPYFQFDQGLTIAGWFRPDHRARTQTLLRKRDQGTSAFALVLHRGRFRFVANLGDGRAASVVAPQPARTGEFQHVAASYDGAALRLYVDGAQVASRDVAGTIAPGAGPLLIGNDGSERRFDGAIDDAVFDLHALTPAQVLELNCVPVAPLVVASPETSEPTLPDVPVVFDIAVTNRNPAACAPIDVMLFAFNQLRNITLVPDLKTQVSPPVANGETTHFTLTATPFDSVETGAFPINFEVTSLAIDFLFSGTAHLVVAEPSGCHVRKSRELMITDLSVVEDSDRTANGPFPGDGGAWSFRHLMEEMAATPDDAPELVEDLLHSYLAPQVVNGLTAEPRFGLKFFLDAWPRDWDGRLDLWQPPIKLQAIVNRIDLRDLAHGNAGVVSFVFALTDVNSQLPFTLLLEYELPAATETDVLAWAQAFHALGALPPGESYNAALQAITEQVVTRGARPTGVNGSALRAVRSNEPFGGLDWQFRQFALSPATGRLALVPLDQTPHQFWNGSLLLQNFINNNRDAILAGTYTVPDRLEGQPFRAAVARNSDFERWRPQVDGEARRAFALGTCNGCHSAAETGVQFQQVFPPFGLGEVALSPFLRGTTIPDPETGAPRQFNDLRRRADDLAAMVCPPGDGAASLAPRVSLRRGISRVH